MFEDGIKSKPWQQPKGAEDNIFKFPVWKN